MKFQQSRLAKELLTGLKGIEIGGAAHNSFDLDTINVDLFDAPDAIFKEMQIGMCGEFMPIDIVAPGDCLPFEDSSWDFVISSHVLEHFYDPITTLKEWYRVTKDGGYIFMIIPHKERTFDSPRERTTLDELIARCGNTAEGSEDIHWSVWITKDVLDLAEYMGYEVVAVQDTDDKVGNGFTVVVKVNKAAVEAVVETPVVEEAAITPELPKVKKTKKAKATQE